MKARESTFAVQVEPAVSASLVTRASRLMEPPAANAAIVADGMVSVVVTASGGKVMRVLASAAPPAAGTSSTVAPVAS